MASRTAGIMWVFLKGCRAMKPRDPTVLLVDAAASRERSIDLISKLEANRSRSLRLLTSVRHSGLRPTVLLADKLPLSLTSMECHRGYCVALHAPASRANRQILLLFPGSRAKAHRHLHPCAAPITALLRNRSVQSGHVLDATARTTLARVSITVVHAHGWKIYCRKCVIRGRLSVSN